MKTADLNYSLPQELIAQKPPAKRGDSRLMVVNRRTKEIIHTNFANLQHFLQPGDLLVVNDTKVMRAKIKAHKDNGSGVELTYIKSSGYPQFLIKGKVETGEKLHFNKFAAQIITKTDNNPPIYSLDVTPSFTENDLQQIGTVMLPPYIKEASPEERYQTVYAKDATSIAAPTAGLHFTKIHLKQINNIGVNIAHITLDVGLGTFLPIKVDNTKNHIMYKETYKISRSAAKIITDACINDNRIITVGTTSLRALESAAECNDYGCRILASQAQTDLFITPGYQFKIADGLLTNFHLPKSTLLVLVYAFGGTDLIKRAYNEAIGKKYRFFSFGDAMLII